MSHFLKVSSDMLLPQSLPQLLNILEINSLLSCVFKLMQFLKDDGFIFVIFTHSGKCCLITDI
jgi:hypothetical protein